jgi:hypothetical protein
MTAEPIIIAMNIAHYGAMLKLDLDDENHSIVARSLTEAEQNWTLTHAAR